MIKWIAIHHRKPLQFSGMSKEFIHTVYRIEFLGEQDGSPERDLKNALIEHFDKDRITTRAYLARVRLDTNKAWSVALCVRINCNKPASRYQSEIGRVFSSLFKAEEFLDTVILDHDKERRLKEVCPPFYDQPKKPSLLARLFNR